MMTNLVCLLSGGLESQPGVSGHSGEFLKEGVTPLPPLILRPALLPGLASTPVPPAGVPAVLSALTSAPAPASPAAPLAAPGCSISASLSSIL